MLTVVLTQSSRTGWRWWSLFYSSLPLGESFRAAYRTTCEMQPVSLAAPGAFVTVEKIAPPRPAPLFPPLCCDLVQHSHLRSCAEKDTRKAPLKTVTGLEVRYQCSSWKLWHQKHSEVLNLQLVCCISVQSGRLAISSSVPEASEHSSLFIAPLLPVIYNVIVFSEQNQLCLLQAQLEPRMHPAEEKQERAATSALRISACWQHLSPVKWCFDRLETKALWWAAKAVWAILQLMTNGGLADSSRVSLTLK